MKKQLERTKSVMALASFLLAGSSLAGILDPTNAPGPTMHTLEEIYQMQVDTHQRVEAIAVPQSLAATTTVINTGYYVATNLTQVETNLAAGNIKKNVTIFGVAGTLMPASVPKTGQMTSYQAGDDAYYKNGASWPNPRFTAGMGPDATNCVTDNLTGLVWARNANLAGPMTWSNALVYCEGLTYGGTNDWRLPNRSEMSSLIALQFRYPAICNTAGTGQWTQGDPFTGVLSDYYWTSSAESSDMAWPLSLVLGMWSGDGKGNLHYVWPVRGGQ